MVDKIVSIKIEIWILFFFSHSRFKRGRHCLKNMKTHWRKKLFERKNKNCWKIKWFSKTVQNVCFSWLWCYRPTRWLKKCWTMRTLVEILFRLKFLTFTQIQLQYKSLNVITLRFLLNDNGTRDIWSLYCKQPIILTILENC